MYIVRAMANTSSARKAERASARKRVFNVRCKKALHDATKTLSKALAASASDVVKQLSSFQQTLDKAVKRGTLTKNAAARMKSRMSRRLGSN